MTQGETDLNLDVDEELALYKEFGVSKSATQDEIKRAYRSLALKVHPDKLSHLSEQDRTKATARFQDLSTWYALLSDPIKRKRYDETGSIEDATSLFSDLKDDQVSWEEFFKTMFDGVVSEKTINEYKEKYRYSEEERIDVLEAYHAAKGDMLKIIHTVPCSELSDLARFQHLVQKAINNGEVQEYAKFRKVSEKELRKQEKLAHAEAKEAEKILIDMKARGAVKKKADGENSEDELRAMILDKNASRMESLVNNLKKKYAEKEVKKVTTSKGKKKRKTESEIPPSEEEFLALQADMDRKRSINSKRKTRRVAE